MWERILPISSGNSAFWDWIFSTSLLVQMTGHQLWITATEPDPKAAPPPFGHASKVYNVIDSRQAYLQNIVVQGLQALGFEEQAKNSIHFSYEMVALTPACCDELGFPL